MRQAPLVAVRHAARSQAVLNSRWRGCAERVGMCWGPAQHVCQARLLRGRAPAGCWIGADSLVDPSQLDASCGRTWSYLSLSALPTYVSFHSRSASAGGRGGQGWWAAVATVAFKLAVSSGPWSRQGRADAGAVLNRHRQTSSMRTTRTATTAVGPTTQRIGSTLPCSVAHRPAPPRQRTVGKVEHALILDFELQRVRDLRWVVQHVHAGDRNGCHCC